MFSFNINTLIDRLQINWPGQRNIIIWSTGLLTLFGLTIKDLCPILTEYISNYVATQIRIVDQNSITSKQPGLTLCIPWSDIKLKNLAIQVQKNLKNKSACEKMANQSWDVWRNVEFPNIYDLDSVNETISQAIVRKLFYEENFNVLKIDNSWNQPIFDVIYNFFLCVKKFDITMGGDNQNRLWCFYDQIGDLFLSHKSKIDLLFGSLVDILCKYTIVGDTYSNHSNQPVCADSLSNGILTSGFCFPLSPIDGDRINVYVNVNNSQYGLWPAITHSDQPFYLLSDSGPVAWFDQLLNDSYSVYLSQDVAEWVHVRYRVQMIVKENRSEKKLVCYKEESQSSCQLNCMLEKIAEICRCIPFTLRNYNNRRFKDLSYCKSTFYGRCKINRDEQARRCKNNCINPCEFRSYNWQTTRLLLPQTERIFNLTIYPITGSFVEFSITRKDTPEQFLTQVGALLNFYLGFSGLSAIALIIFCCDLIKRWRLTRNLSNMTQEKDSIELCCQMKTKIENLENENKNSLMEIRQEIAKLQGGDWN